MDQPEEYPRLCSGLHLVGDFTPDEEDPLKFRSDLWRLSRDACQLARLADELYTVAPRTEEEAEAEAERARRPRPLAPSTVATASDAALDAPLDAGSLRGYIGVYQWLSRILPEQGVDLAALHATEHTPATSAP